MLESEKSQPDREPTVLEREKNLCKVKRAYLCLNKKGLYFRALSPARWHSTNLCPSIFFYANLSSLGIPGTEPDIPMGQPLL